MNALPASMVLYSARNVSLKTLILLNLYPCCGRRARGSFMFLVQKVYEVFLFIYFGS